MTASTDSNVKKLVESLQLPGLEHPISEVGRVTGAETSGSAARVSVELGFPAEGVKAAWQDFIADAVKARAASTASSFTTAAPRSTEQISEGFRPSTRSLPQPAAVHFVQLTYP